MRKVVARSVFGRGLPLTLVVASLVLLGVGVTPALATFDLGVAAGGGTSTPAKRWAHAASSGAVTGEGSQKPNFITTVAMGSGSAHAPNNTTRPNRAAGLI